MNLSDMYQKIVYFDTETTGFNPEDRDQVIELAAVSPDSKMDEYVSLFKMPQLPPKIVELTGITDLQLFSVGKKEKDVLEEFIDLIRSDKTLLVAYNAGFDLRFIGYALMRCQVKEWLQIFNACDYLDSMTVYKDRRPYPHKLFNAISAYNLSEENSHNALDDCMALKAVTEAMNKEKDDLDKYVNVFGYNPKYGPDTRLKKVVYLPQGYFKSCEGKPLYERS